MTHTARRARRMAWILAMFLTGCGQASLERQAAAALDTSVSRGDTRRTAPAVSAMQFAAVPPTIESSALPSSSAFTCVVARLSDGDSFTCADGRQVRLLLIDAPEMAQKPWGEMAKRQLASLAGPGTTVRLELDRSPTDRYGRTLAYAWVGSVMINERMVANGWALVLAYENVRYLERMQRAERAAREARKGFWQAWAFRCRPVDFRARRCGAGG